MYIMKKLFGIILCAVLLITAALPAVVNAELVEGKLNIVIENVEAVPGAEIDVKIELKNNTTISSAKILLTFDKKLSVVKDTSGDPMVTFDIYNSADESAMKGVTLYEADGQLLLNWLTATGEVKGDTVYATVTFKVADDAEVGAVLPITATIDPDDVYDINLDNIAFAQADGGITVKSKGSDVLVGDCNNDGSVDNKDVVVLFRYVSSENKLDDETAYDFNGDGTVDNKDVVSLFRYVSAQ